MTENLLICTVGGSHQPIVTAIREARPAYVVFLCTDRNPTTGAPGSRREVEGKGNVIKARWDETTPSLPNIPTQCGLAPEQFEVRIVSTDALDDVVAQALRAMADLRERFPQARLLADYTGGTKTMTAGLVMAALERPDVELRLVTGARGDLVRVHDGSQRSVPAITEAVRLRRAMEPLLGAWQRYGYGEAAQGLERIATPTNERLRGEWQIALDLSRALDAWDRFDHARALEILSLYRPRIGSRAGLHLKFLEILAAPVGEAIREPAQLFDLWLNAQRRAAQGRYDDAVARGYRLLEWTAQWLLREQAGIDTADVPAQRIPQGMTLSLHRDGRRQAGLAAAWQLVGAHLSGPPRAFAEHSGNRMLEHLKMRNESILAHGFRPIAAADWADFHAWLEQNLLPVLQNAANDKGLRMQPPQLPTEPLWDAESR